MLSLFSFSFYSFVFAAALQCPTWKNEMTPFRSEMFNPGLDCRATCKKNSDCIVQADPCGRRYTINKDFSSEMKEATEKINVRECPQQIKLPLNEKAECIKNKCKIQELDCKTANAQSNEYFEANFHQKCKVDKECSFVLKPNEKCVEYLPTNTSQNNLVNESELSYIKERVLRSCLKNKPVYCPKKEKSQCFAGECIQVDEKIPFVSYLNFEGSKAIANYKSRTEPLLTPSLSEVKCQKKNDCEVVTGVCGQYAVTLNKAQVGSFKLKIKETEIKIACPVFGKVTLPVPECFKNFCVFKE